MYGGVAGEAGRPVPLCRLHSGNARLDCLTGTFKTDGVRLGASLLGADEASALHEQSFTRPGRR